MVSLVSTHRTELCFIKFHGFYFRGDRPIREKRDIRACQRFVGYNKNARLVYIVHVLITNLITYGRLLHITHMSTVLFEIVAVCILDLIVHFGMALLGGSATINYLCITILGFIYTWVQEYVWFIFIYAPSVKLTM